MRNVLFPLDHDDASNMSEIGSTSTLSRLRSRTSRKRCDIAMCNIGLLLITITGIDARSIVVAREEAILEEQGTKKKRSVSFTKNKAEPVLTGYRAGNMWKSNSISSDETSSGNDGIFNTTFFTDKHRTQSLGRRSKSSSQPNVDGVYRRIDSESSVFTESETIRSNAPLLSNKTSSRNKHGRSNKAAKHVLKSKSSDSLPRNTHDGKKNSPSDSHDQRYSLPDMESQLPPPHSSSRDPSLQGGLKLELNGGKKVKLRAQKSSSSTEESSTPSSLTPESETAKGVDDHRLRAGRTASATTTDL